MFNVTTDTRNKDIPGNMTRAEARQFYLDMWGTFNTKCPPPAVQHLAGDKYVLRADLAPGGLKAFGAERVIAETKEDTLVYCAPRQGHAPDAIAMLAEMYDKKVVFFCPASTTVSDHQGSLFAYDHVDVRFIKIAAMPVLNAYAKEWAERNNAKYLPFGLTGEKTVTAGLINMAVHIENSLGKQPSQIWCAVSTGTMIRALQIGWPNAEAHGIAVARNIHPGEIGEAKVISATVPFLKADPIAETMPFPTTSAYDAKAWKGFIEQGKKDAIFINVGSDQHINRNLDKINVNEINSKREWKDMGDFLKNRAYDKDIEVIKLDLKKKASLEEFL